MSTVSSSTTSSTNGYSTLKPLANPIAKSSNSGLVQAAANLSAEEGVVATLGSVSTSSLTYDAASILNSLVQAGTLSASSSTPVSNTSPPTSAVNSTNQNIVNSLSTNPDVSGTYNPSGLLQGQAANTSPNWATALKANPSLASTIISDSFNQGIVGTLSTSA